MDAGADVTPPVAAMLAGRYSIGEVLGVGGTAIVYRATDCDTGLEVAVKIFNPGVAAADGLPGHRSVAAALAEIDHPGLVETHESGLDADRMYLVMRLVEGPSLSARFHGGPLPTTEVLAIGARLADTLAHVHDRGIVHRDIKPSNILLDADQTPYLTDFGISRLVDTTRVTATGMTVGTPAYMAPEQVRGQRVGHACDIYSLGLVLLEAVTGRREYPGAVVESAVARLHRDPAVPDSLPAPIADLLTGMTAQNPVDRPTAATVAARLHGASGTTREIPATTTPPTDADDARAPGADRRFGVWIAAAAAAVLIAAVVSGLLDLTGYADPATATTTQYPSAVQEQRVLPPTTVAAVPTADAAAPPVRSSPTQATSPGLNAAQRVAPSAGGAASPPEAAVEQVATVASGAVGPSATGSTTVEQSDTTPDETPRTDNATGNSKKGPKAEKKSKKGDDAEGAADSG